MSPRAFLATAPAALLLLSATVASAQVSEVAIARQLAIQGIDAVESGDCKKGVPLLERAEKMHHASVHLQYLARCHGKSGHLVIATEMWRQIVREGAPPGASQAVLGAITEAQTSLEQTLPRLASTTLRAAADYPGLTLTLDGVTIPAEIVGTPQAVDPGQHRVVASAPGFSRASREWTVPEGGSAEVVLELTPEPHAASQPDGTPPPDGAAPSSGTRSAFPLATVGWITGAAGAMSLVAGTVTLLTRNNRREELRTNCPDRAHCGAPGTKYAADPGSLDSDKNAISTLTTASNVLLFGGGALLAGGVVMIVLGSGSHEAEPKTALLFGGPGAGPGLTLRGHW